MKKIILLFFLFWGFVASAQVINVTNVSVTGRFNSCPGPPSSTLPVVTATLIPSPNATVVNGVFTCNNPCDSSTIEISMANINWDQFPNVEWLHGLFLPVNAGFLITPVTIPAGFIAYNPGCTGVCPTGTSITGGPGFYYDNTAANSCCGVIAANDGDPENNWGDGFYDCGFPFNLTFRLKFCNSEITSGSYTFIFTGTSDAQTGCWDLPDATGPHTLSFTIATNPCTFPGINLSASAPVRTCTNNVVNYTSTLTGTCSATNITWWDAPNGGNLLGTGSPFVYDPPGSACPAGTTIYATCCGNFSNGCSVKVPVTVPGSCNPLTITNISTTNPTCTTPGSINSVTVANGVAPVSYTLDPGNINNSTGVFNNLTGSTYTVTVSDASGCSITSLVQFILPPSPTVTLSLNPSPTCTAPGTITATGSGGTPAYQYSLNGGAYQAGTTFSVSAAGVYTITVQDANNCTGTGTVQVVLPVPPVVSAVLSTPPTCTAPGTITATGSGGTPAYQYSLNGGAYQAGTTFSVSAAGIYTITVQDANNCTGTTTIQVITPNGPVWNTVSVNSVSCNGQNNGSINVTVTGGMPALSYSLNGGPSQGSGAFNNLISGTYTIVVTDANNCTLTTIVNVNEPPPLIIDSLIISDVLCAGQTNGSISVYASGGASGFQYSLNAAPFQASNIFNNLGAGMYTITVQDANGCTVTSTTNVSAPVPIVFSGLTSQDVLCSGDTSGSIVITAGGGIGPYNYSINGGPLQNNGSFTGLIAGNYTIVVSDANGCTLSTVLPIMQPSPLQITGLNGMDPSCIPGMDGSILVNAGGGTPSYLYSVNNGPAQPSNQFNNLGAGIYTIVVADVNNCTVQATILLQVPNPPQIDSVLISDASCSPGNDGSLSITASGGTPGYNYSINGGALQSSNVFNNLGSGIYTIVVQDANGCTVSSLSMVQTPNAPVINGVDTTFATCNPGCDAQAIINSSGGLMPYQYALNASSYQGSNTFMNLCVGNYTVIVQDANGCTVSSVFVIASPASPQFTSTQADSVSCQGFSDGQITALVSGGLPNYQYQINGGAFQSNGVFPNLIAGNYTLQVADANGCTATTIANVYEPLPLQWDSVTSTGSSCSGSSNGTLVAIAQGGVPSITYSIVPAATQTSPGVFTNLTGNTNYLITAVDAHNCSISTNVFIPMPVSLSITGISNIPVSCYGMNDGQIGINVSGGTPGYSFQLIPGSITNSIGSFTGLSGGVYTIMVTDANLCTISTTVNVFEPAPLQIDSLSVQDILCNGDANGSIQVFSSGGNSNFTYTLVPGNITNTGGLFGTLSGNVYTVTVADGNNCTVSASVQLLEPSAVSWSSVVSGNILCHGQSSGTINVQAQGGTGSMTYVLNPLAWTSTNGTFTTLPAQTYQIAATDANGCSILTTVILSEPSAMTNSVQHTNVKCFGGNDGTIQVTSAGGVSPYNYLLLPLNISNTSGSFQNLYAGNYSVVTTDANGCQDTTALIVIAQPGPMVWDTVFTQDVVCYGDNTGSVLVQSSGGTGNISYSITPGSLQSSPGYFSQLVAGIYTVTASDQNACILSTQVLINQNPEIQLNNVYWEEPVCYGEATGSLVLTASGGVGTLAYSLNGNPFTTSNLFSGLPGGVYQILIRDSLDCILDTVVTLHQPDKVIISGLEIQDIHCPGSNDGAVIVQGSGGTGSFTYYIRPGIHVNQHGIFNNLHQGVYTLSVIDQTGCEADTIIVIDPPQNPLRFTVNKKDLGCFGYGYEGWAEVVPTGGEPPFSYLWSGYNINEQGVSRIENLTWGHYYIDVIDAYGCALRDTVIIHPGPCCEEVFIPNAFSPNDDRNNDEVTVFSSAGIELIQFQIFNRWGQIVWTAQGYHDAWDGTYQGRKADLGTYFYLFKYVCNTDGKTYIKKGDITLVR